jgi:hypothetical protein
VESYLIQQDSKDEDRRGKMPAIYLKGQTADHWERDLMVGKPSPQLVVTDRKSRFSFGKLPREEGHWLLPIVEFSARRIKSQSLLLRRVIKEAPGLVPSGNLRRKQT